MQVGEHDFCGIIRCEPEENGGLVFSSAAASEVGEGAEGDEGDVIHIGDGGHGGGLHVEGVGMKGVPGELPIGGVVHKGLAADAVAAHDDPGFRVQAVAGGGAAVQFHAASDAVGHRQGRGVHGKPEALLGLIGRIALAGDGDFAREHHAVVGETARPPTGVPAGGRLAGEHLFLILAPLRGYDHVADLQIRVHAAGDAGEDDLFHRKMVEQGLGGHGGVDHAVAAQEEDDFMVGEAAEIVTATIEDLDALDLGLLAERGEFRFKRRDDGEAGRGIGSGDRGGGRGGAALKEQADQGEQAGEPRFQARAPDAATG